jgi:hypothetical protein
MTGFESFGAFTNLDPWNVLVLNSLLTWHVPLKWRNVRYSKQLTNRPAKHIYTHRGNTSVSMSAYRLAIMGKAFAEEISRKYTAFEKEFNMAIFVDPSFLPSILPTPRRSSSGWALASWTICLHSTQFFINPRLTVWFLNNLVFTVWGC